VSRSALVIGGTGPTGPHILQGLLDRGFEVTILHRGTHEPPELPDVEHIHADPHFEDPLREAIGDGEWDVVAGMYGRAAVVARVLQGRCGHYLSVSGIPVHAGYGEPHLTFPYGMAIGAHEAGPLVDGVPVARDDAPIAITFARKILAVEGTVLGLHPSATCFRYPMIYGPRNLIQWEWSVVKRVLDDRPWMLLPDHGTSIYTRCAAENAAHAVLLAVDHPAAAGGEAFNVADQQQFSLRQWVDVISDAVGRRLDVRSVPSELCRGWADTVAPQTGDIAPHNLTSSQKIRDLLGFTDVVEAADALAASARWFLDHPVTDGGGAGFFDTFDYEYEDALVDRYAQLCEQVLAEFPPRRPEPMHAMPHPVAPGRSDPRGR
jgi:nucleoside-diphosphate-sugar epimerase